MDFLDSTWFKTHGQTQDLPCPDHLRSLHKPRKSPHIVKFEDAITLWAIRHLFHDAVPVPEIYAWRVLEQEGKTREVYIYMQLVPGPTLRQQWPNLSATDKHTICADIKAKLACLRSLQDGESQKVIGSICHGPGTDIWLEDLPLLRPFPSRAVFHDWLSWLWRRHVPDLQSIEDPWRDLFLDHGSIVFTHGDLHRSNIIVTDTSPTKVVAILDWEQSGWYPDYWEDCKARWTTSYTEEWWGWIDQFLPANVEALEAFNFYTNTLGRV